MNEVAVDKIHEFEKTFIELLKSTHKEDVMDQLKAGILNDDIAAILKESAKTVVAQFKAKA